MAEKSGSRYKRKRVSGISRTEEKKREPSMTDKRRLPDPQELAIFLEVAKQKSFSQAALRLGVTTSSVSQSVTHLEKSLDATLVNRGPPSD